MNPKCEPQLGERGLYEKIGGQSDSKVKQLAILWVLNLSDGNQTLLDISNKSDIKFDIIKDAAETLVDHGLLKQISD